MTFTLGSLATSEQGCTLCYCIVDQVGQALHGTIVNDGSEVHVLVHGITELECSHLGGEACNECVSDSFLDKHAVCSNTGLTTITHLGQNRTFDCSVEVSVIKDDEGSIATQLHGALHNVLGCKFHQGAAHGGGASERNLAHALVS